MSPTKKKPHKVRWTENSLLRPITIVPFVLMLVNSVANRRLNSQKQYIWQATDKIKYVKAMLKKFYKYAKPKDNMPYS